jgi:hypothetical protein
MIPSNPPGLKVHGHPAEGPVKRAISRAQMAGNRPELGSSFTGCCFCLFRWFCFWICFYTIYAVEWVLSDLLAMVKHLMETING